MFTFKKNLQSLAIVMMLIGVIIFILFPVFYSAVFSGFNQHEEIMKNNHNLFPKQWNWENYKIAFNSNYWSAFSFSFFTALILVILRLFFCGAAGYALSKKELKNNRTIMLIFALLAMVPENSLYLGLLIRTSEWQLNKNAFLFLALIAPSIFSFFTILIFQDAFASINQNQKLLAKIDRLSFFQKLTIIYWSKLKYAIIFTTIITTVGAWNSYLWPIIILPANEHTLSTYVFSLGNLPDGSISYSIRLAGVVIYTLPALLFYIIFHRKIIKTFNSL